MGESLYEREGVEMRTGTLQWQLMSLRQYDKLLKKISAGYKFDESYQSKHNRAYMLEVVAQHPFVTSSLLKHYKQFGVKDAVCRCGKLKPFRSNARFCYKDYCSGNCARTAPDRIERIKQTCNERYGGNGPMSSKSVRAKSRQTCMKKYGVPYTCLTEPIRQKLAEANTGVRYSLSDDVKLKMSDKSTKTRRRNGTFKTSYQEDLAVAMMDSLFNGTTQYRSDKYPFLCDYHITESDTYVEFNFSWTHGSEPYRASESTCKATLKTWKKLAKSSKFYKNAIDTWTRRDVLKRMTAKKNRLDYLEFFSIREFCSWFVDQQPFDDRYLRGMTKTQCVEALVNMFKAMKVLIAYKNPTFRSDVIFKYHKTTLLNSRVGNNLTPLEALEDKNCIISACLNCMKYMPHLLLTDHASDHIANRFTVAKIAPIVTTFKPSLTRRLLKTYAPDAAKVVDPFSGFSGRLIGTTQLGLSYAGFDHNRQIVKESNQLINDLSLSNCSVKCKDLFKTEKTSAYDTLITCPPYNLKETWGKKIEDLSCDQWITEVLKRYKCKTYIFVVDRTIKYSKYVVETRLNGKAGTHINRGQQSIIVMRRRT